MTDSTPIGMVEHLDAGPGPTADEITFVRAYLADGPMDSDLLAKAFDPVRLAEREARVAALRASDWPNLGQYRAANALQVEPVQCVFIGDSITEAWAAADPDLFSDGILGRGISGQTSPQILLRFMADVVALKPRVVHLLCGANDIAGNTGPTTFADYQNNVLAMIALAKAHDIQVILGNYAGFQFFTWAPTIDPKPWVKRMNAWLRELARDGGHVFADYNAALDAGDGTMSPDVTRDGVHPTNAGYVLMRPVALEALRAAGVRS